MTDPRGTLMCFMCIRFSSDHIGNPVAHRCYNDVCNCSGEHTLTNPAREARRNTIAEQSDWATVEIQKVLQMLATLDPNAVYVRFQDPHDWLTALGQVDERTGLVVQVEEMITTAVALITEPEEDANDE